MERNRLLKQTSVICKIFSYLQLLGIVFATLALIHWHIDKDFYQKVKVNEGEGVSFTIVSSEKGEKLPDVEKVNITLSQLDASSLYVAYVQGILLMAVLYLIFREFGKVVYSVKVIDTFQSANIISFRKIGKYFLLIFWISGWQFLSVKGVARVGFDFEITPLILMLVSYILAEIFKEGNRLQEEHQLTV